MGEVTRHYAGHWPVGDRAGPFKMTFVFNSMYNEKSNIAIHERGGRHYAGHWPVGLRANGHLDKGLCQIMLVVTTNANNCYCNLITVCKKDMLMFVSVICMLVRIA